MIYYILNPHNIDVLKTLNSLTFYEVKQMHGRSGIHTSKDDNDLLIIAAGYDHSRIVEWQPKRKDARKKVLLFGFPAISPGMFQENILRAHEAEAAIETECFKDMDSNIYAPAYDPFVTAQAISEYVESRTSEHPLQISTCPHYLRNLMLLVWLVFLWEHGFNKTLV